MSLWKIVIKSLRQHAFSTCVTALSIALAGGLLMSVWSVKEQCRATFTQIDGGFDGVLGARSSKLQLVLNAIFHLEASPANVTREDYETISKHPRVSHAIPIAMGDNYRGYRVVGTLTNMFTDIEYVPGQKHALQPGGRWFETEYKEAVVGSFAARRLGLKVGDHFHPYHGLNFDEEHVHDEDEYLVVGILEPSNTPADRVIWVPLAGVQRMTGHAVERATEVSAVLVKLRSPLAGPRLDEQFNKDGTRLTFAWPIGATMANLLNKISWIEKVLALVAYLVAIVAAASVMASIYNSIGERRQQIALMRALGAHRSLIVNSVVLESTAIAAIGMAGAYLVLAAILTAAGSVIRSQTGVEIEIIYPHAVLYMAPVGMIALGALAGIVPAIKAYQTDVATHLSA